MPLLRITYFPDKGFLKVLCAKLLIPVAKFSAMDQRTASLIVIYL